MRTTLAGLLIKQGHPDDALSILERSLAIQRRLLGPNDLEMARTENNLGNAYRVLRRYEEVLPHLEHALKIRETVLGPAHQDVARQLGNLGSVRWALHDLPGAARDLERSLAINEQVYGTDHIAVARSLDDLTMLYRDQDCPRPPRLRAGRVRAGDNTPRGGQDG